MPLYLTSANHCPVTLPQLLASRDARQARQRAWIERYAIPLVSFTVVAPGPIKDSELTRRVFNLGIRTLRQRAASHGWEIKKQLCLPQPTGPEGYMAIAAPEAQLKLDAVDLEQTQLAGRLWDIDVFDERGRLLSRSDLGLPPRKCLLCEQEASICARTRTHPLAELIARMEALLHDAENEAYARP